MFILLGTLSFIPIHDFSTASISSNNYASSSLNDVNDAFDHIYGNAGHVALAVSEEDNLIFTNAHEGIAFVQLDDFSNSTIYREEIGLSDVQVQNLEVDTDLKLLYVGWLGGVDILNYSEMPITATPLISGVATNFELGDFIDIDPETHYVWIVTQSHGLFIYDPFNDRFLDTSGYNTPDPSTGMLTVEVNTTAYHAFIGTKEGFYMLNTFTNDTHWYNSDWPLPYNVCRVLKYYPSKGYLLIGSLQDVTQISGGLTVFDTSTYVFVDTYNWTDDPYYPRSIYDLEVDLSRDLGYIVSGPSTNAESGLLVFNASTFEGIAKSAWGSIGSFGPPLVYGAPNFIESMIASLEIDNNSGDLICGSVRLLQRIAYTPPTSAVTENSETFGLASNYATDVNYDPDGNLIYVSTLLGLDRINPVTQNIEHLISNIGGAGGDTSGELLVGARLMYHHRYFYDITSGTADTSTLGSILPFEEYGMVVDISSSHNESLLYYSISAETGGVGSNGSMIIFNRLSNEYWVEDFGYNKSELEVHCIIQHPTDEVLYVGTGESMIIYNLTTLTEITRYEDPMLWDVRSFEWIEDDLWVGLGEGPYIHIFHPETGLYDTFEGASKILYPSINDIYLHEDKNEVYICANSGLYVFNLTNSELKHETEAEDLSTMFTCAAVYSEITDEIYIGSFQGINIYDSDFDNRFPDVDLELPGVVLSGTFGFEAKSADYSGIKNITVEFWNSTFKRIWTNLSDWLSISFDTTQYDNGLYTLTAYATDWNDLLNSTSVSVQIDNVVIGEYTILTTLILFPVIGVIGYYMKKKR